MRFSPAEPGTLRSYSAEEPCFTRCLPAALKSFGTEFASLKNPNTCWDGYTTARGGELVNWIGTDGTSILTVPRYAVEALQENSCWQTIAHSNSMPRFGVRTLRFSKIERFR